MTRSLQSRALVLFVALTVSCSDPTSPVTHGVPDRIVSLLPSHTETLLALGLEAHLVGVDDFSEASLGTPSLPRLGGPYDAPLEPLLALKPDLVLTSPWSTAVPFLVREHLVVWAREATRYEEVFPVFVEIGRLVGKASEGALLAERVRAEVSRVAQAVRRLPRVRVYLELDATPYAVGPGSFVGEVLSKAGGDNVVPEALGAFPKVSPELIVATDPDLILGATLEDVARRPGWGSLRAVAAGRVDTLTVDEREVVFRPGPRLADGLAALARHLHPEASW